MKKTQGKDSFRNIRKRIVSYLSVGLVIMLGLGGVFITKYMGAGIDAEAARYYNDHGFKTYELISSLGVSDEDVTQIRNTEGVTDAEGVIRTNGTFTKGDLSCNIEIISMTERISVPEVVEGKAPAAKNECMVAEDFAEAKGLKVGDRVKLAISGNSKATVDTGEEKQDGKKKEVILEKDFTITGFMNHPDYFRRNSTDVVALPWAAFNKEYLGESQYSHVFVRTADPEGVDIFSDKYFEKTADTKKALEELADTLEIDTLVRVQNMLNEKVDEQWQEALDEFEAAQNEIDDNEATLNNELADARKKLDDAQNELDDMINKYNKKIKAGEKKIKASEKDIKDGEKDIKDGEKDIKTAEKKIKDSEKKIKEGEKEIKDGEKKIKDAEAEIKDGEKKLKDTKDKLKLADEKLPQIKAYIKEETEKYEGQLKDALSEIAQAQNILDKLSKIGDPDSEEFKKTVRELAQFFVDREDKIKKIQNFFKRDDVMEAAVKIKEYTGVDATGVIEKIRAFDVDGFIKLAKEVLNENGDINAFIEKTKAFLKTIRDELDKLKEYENYVKEYEANRDKLYKQVADKEKELKDAKTELEAKKKELDRGRKKLEHSKKTVEEAKKALAKGKRDLKKYKKKLEEAKKKLAAGKKDLDSSKKKLASEKRKYQTKINNGWNQYFAQKADYEQRLEEAKELLAENREEAEAKIESIREDIDDLECKWLVLDRRANAGYVDAKSNIRAINSASLIFGVLFMLISAVVCFSTLSIIIEEQKKMVGTVKAFGFHKGEILGKYLVFGVSAAVIGCIAGILLALGLSGVVLKAYHNSGMYQFAQPKSVVTPGVTIIACAIMIAICAVSTIIACSDILKSPASILMKGGTAKKGAGYRKEKSKSSRGGSLYSKLIIRNMLDDKVRVIISILIIAFSTFLVGTGISMKVAFDGMADKQVSDIYNYDIKVDLDDKVTDADKTELEKVMAEDGVEYTKASYETHVFRLGDRLDALTVIAGRQEELGNYYTINDSKTGEALELPEDGVLAQKKMKESYGFDEGSTLSVFSSELDECSADVKGVFQNYVGRVVITSNEGYGSIFGSDPPDNCYFIKLGGAEAEKLKNDMLAVNENISFEEASEFVKKFNTASLLYNLIVIVTTGIAILMSFMILSNLANIFLNRKKTELTVMRINGFSIKQTKGYLTRETIVTTAAGVILGVLLGAIATPLIIKAMEQPDLQFVRSFNVLAWVVAVALEVIFAVVIYSVVFRKVKDLNFRDVA